MKIFTYDLTRHIYELNITSQVVNEPFGSLSYYKSSLPKIFLKSEYSQACQD